MTKILVIKREVLFEQIEQFINNKPEHIFIINVINNDIDKISLQLPDSLQSQVLDIKLDNIKSAKQENVEKLTHEKAELLMDFIFMIRNKKLDVEKKLIIACNDGRYVSGSIGLWAMDWLMDGNEDEFYKLNPDVKPNELILYDLYLHPII